MAVLRSPEAHGADQSLPLKPAKPKNTKQPARDRGGLRNNRAIYLDVIEFELEIGTIGLPTGEQQSQGEIVYVESRSGRDQDSYNASRCGRQRNEAAKVCRERQSAIGAHLKLNSRVAVSVGIVGETDGRDVIDTLRRGQKNLQAQIGLP